MERPQAVAYLVLFCFVLFLKQQGSQYSCTVSKASVVGEECLVLTVKISVYTLVNEGGHL